MKTETTIKISNMDYTILCEMLRTRKSELGESAGKLASELKRAEIVDSSLLEKDIVKINSFVKILDTIENKSFTIKIVFPSDSDIAKRKISVFAPLGTALLGFKKGDHIEWDVPAGKRTFRIEDVIND